MATLPDVPDTIRNVVARLPNPMTAVVLRIECRFTRTPTVEVIIRTGFPLDTPVRPPTEIRLRRTPGRDWIPSPSESLVSLRLIRPNCVVSAVKKFPNGFEEFLVVDGTWDIGPLERADEPIIVKT